MPNWCEGNIRLRGSKEAIKKFLENEILFTVTENALSSKTLPAVVTDVYGDLQVSRGQTEKGASWDAFYIKDTRRNFIDGTSFEVYVDDEDEHQVVCIDGFKAAWGVDPSPYVEKAKKHGIDIRIVGFERGMQFMQVVEIVNGELVAYEEKQFGDWYWECPMPNMGG